MCMGFVQSYAALVGVRFLLGVFEAGLGPGSIYLIAMYYRRYELPWRLSWWYCSGRLPFAHAVLVMTKSLPLSRHCCRRIWGSIGLCHCSHGWITRLLWMALDIRA